MDTRHRLTCAATLALLPVIPLAIRLTHLQVMLHERLDIKASGQFKRSSQEVVPRGTIMDRNGHVLAESIPSWGSLIDKSEITSPEAVASRLAPALGVPPAEIIRKIKAAQYVRTHGGEVCPVNWEPGGKTLKPGLELVGKI